MLISCIRRLCPESSKAASRREAIEALTSSSYRQFSLDEINRLTNFFDLSTARLFNDLTERVVKISGYDEDGKSESTLAVVKSYYYNHEFESEVRLMMNIEVHPNIISLIGYCIEMNKRILVFKYTENGHLHDFMKKGTAHEFWSWKKVVEFCLQVGYALQHLHSPTTEFPSGIYHGDFWESSILLDENWDPKISFSGKSRFKSTTNYIFKPVDVFGFGLILSNIRSWHREQTDFADSDISPDSLTTFIDTAEKCNKKEKYERPSIDEVVLDLEAALNFQEVFVPQPISKTLYLLDFSSKEVSIMEEVTESYSLDELNKVTNNLKKNPDQKKKKKKKSLRKNMPSSSSSISSYEKNPPSSPSFISSSSSSLSISSSSSSFNLFTPSYRQFSLSQINKVTNNLDKEKSLREGICWIEFLVQLNLDSEIEKTWATVKQFKGNFTDEFQKEVQMLHKIQAHPNLISLLGYCVESGENILIYNCTEHGSLLDFVKPGSHIDLSWKERLNICLGAALGLQHLHKVTYQFKNGIIHGEVNPANILLDRNWVAKVSNYAGSHLSSTNIVKDPFTRYAPEYQSSNRLTKKVDVYAFGIVLFQVLCRRKIWVQGEESKLDYIEQNYVRWAIENVDIGIKDGISEDSLKKFTECIGKCLKSNPYQRLITMDQVVLAIQSALRLQEGEGEANDLNASFRTTSRLTEGEASMSSESFSLSFSSCRQFPFTVIKDAVGKQLGKGGEGTVYLANIHLDSKSEKVPVAVKLLNTDFIGEFEKEIVTVSKIKHPNIVSLLGYCRESDDKVLIYEYMGKGSLSDYVKIKSKVCLTWKQRLHICLGAARGLQYLHRTTDEFPFGIIHRDVKPDNILINDNWDAKVSDFGMLKLSNVDQTRSTIITAHTIGTPGYFAPECSLQSTKQLSRKIDVYSFGVVMFEVLCRKKLWESGEESVYAESMDVAHLADANIDSRIKGQISDSAKYKFIDTIEGSLNPEVKERLNMNDVVLNLEDALKCQEEYEVLNETTSPS